MGKGESVFVVGPNGAGKTTLLRTISGLERPSSGTMSFQGTSLIGKKAWDVVTSGIAHVPQNRRMFGDLSVEDNLKMGGYTRPAADLEPGLQNIYDLFPVLFEKRRQRAAQLSGGQQQMVAVGRAMMSHAQLIMLDEPSLGLAPMLVDTLGESLIRIRAELGVSVLIVEQNVNLALSVGNRGYILRGGRVIAQGTPDQLRPRLQEAYLGTNPQAEAAAEHAHHPTTP